MLQSFGDRFMHLDNLDNLDNLDLLETIAIKD